MSAPISASSISTPRWTKRSELPARQIERTWEGHWRRLLRWLADRQHLHEMDARLLRDIGLTREDVRRGVPFRTSLPRPPGLIHLRTLDAQVCQFKLYAPAAEAAGLRPEQLAAVRRAVRAVLAEPGPEPVADFATLANLHDADLPAGSLVLTAYRWEGMVLRRCTLLCRLSSACYATSTRRRC